MVAEGREQEHSAVLSLSDPEELAGPKEAKERTAEDEVDGDSGPQLLVSAGGKEVPNLQCPMALPGQWEPGEVLRAMSHWSSPVVRAGSMLFSACLLT